MTFSQVHIRGSRLGLSGTVKVLCMAAATLALGGCKHDGQGTQVAGWSLVDPAQRHPILVSQEPTVLNVRVARGSEGLTPRQRAEVFEFANHFRASDAGNSRIVVSVPSGSANEGSAMGAAEDIRELLIGGGFAESTVAVEAYRSEGASQPPIRISYLRFVAKGPDCGSDWSENLARDLYNTGYPNFGCADQHNLAAMVANPADLLGPRTTTERFSERRDAVMNAWAQGKTTASEKSADERINVKNSD